MELKVKKINQIIIFLFLSLTFLLLPGQNIYEKNFAGAAKPLTKNLPFNIPKPAPYPLKRTKNKPPDLTAKGVIVVDVKSAVVLYAKHEDLPLRPASTTKLMTALVALDKYKLDTILTVKNPLRAGQVMNLVNGEKITVENLLYGLLVYSANDAAYTLAKSYPGGFSEFIKAMNRKAREINLENTHFVNPAGFDNNKQYTSARDLMRLSLFALKNKEITKIVGTPQITVSDVNFLYFHRLTNVNKLLGKVPGVAGVKTGWTEKAKENLVNLTKKNGHEILTVVLGSEDRFGETERLTNWAFNNYQWVEFAKKALPLTDK